MDSLRMRALDRAKGREPTANSVAEVASATSTDAASWAFTQWRLRAAARTKFERADEMLFVKEALEQATDERLAAFHSERFPVGVAVVDLTVGIGSDLIALARRGLALGFETDAERAECARHNLAVNGLRAEVLERDCLGENWPADYAFADPSRRKDGRRLSDPGLFEPDPIRIAERFRGLKLGGIKLSPMLGDAYLASLGGAVEFVSYGRECREALVWLGAEAKLDVRAVHLESGATLAQGDEPHGVPRPEGFLFEADPAAIRAHGLGSLCDKFGLRALGDSNGYLTGPQLVDSPWLRAYRVLEPCTADDKATRAALRRLNASIEAVKVRGPKVDVEGLARRFGSVGERPAVLVVYAVGKSRRHLIVEPART